MEPLTVLTGLIDAILLEMESRRYHKDTIKHHREVYWALRQYCVDIGVDVYTEEIGNLFIQDLLRNKPKLSSGTIKNYRLCLMRLDAAVSGIQWQPPYPSPTPDYAKSRFSDIVMAYESYLYKSGKTSYDVRARVYRVARLLQFSEQYGYTKLSDISIKCIYDAFEVTTDKRAFRTIIGAFLRYAKTYGLVKVDLSPLFPEIRNHITVPAVYSPEEIEQLLASIDRLSLNGKRDYAIILIAARLGLRACDIANMVFDCLCWESRTIELVQLKTKQPLKLPMTDEVRSALCDYINNGRPTATNERIFLCKHGYDAVSPHLISMIVRRAFKRSGINIDNRRHGPHALRSSLATALLHEGNDYSTVQKVLGQKNIQSTKSYARADVEQLREAALSVPLPDGAFAELLNIPVHSRLNYGETGLLAQNLESYKGVRYEQI